MKAGAMRALHSLTAIVLYQIDQMNAVFLPEQRGPKLETIGIYNYLVSSLVIYPPLGWSLGSY